MRRRKSLSLAAIALGVLLTVVGGCSSESDPQVVKANSIRRGDELLKTQQFRQAAAAYRNAINADPKDGELRLKLVEALRSAEQWQEFAKQSVVAGDLLPGNEPAQRRAVGGMLILGRFDDAIERVTPLYSKKPDDAELLLLLAHARARMRNDWWALQVIDEEFRKGLDVQGARLKVRTLTTSKEDAESERLYRRAHALAGEQLEPALALGGFLMADGRYDEALMILEKAAATWPDHTLLTRTLGLYFVQAGQDAPAEKYLKLAAAKGDRTGQFALADFYVRSKRIDEAVAIADAIPSNDADGVINMRAAEIQLQAGKRTQALERAEQVLTKQPDFPRALLVKARVLLADGNAVEAVSWARKAVAQDAVSSDARLTFAEALVATGKLAEAFDQYSEAWRGNTRDPAVAKALARVALALGRQGVAVDLANQSLRLKPGDPDAAVILARSHIRLGEFAQADRALAPFTSGKTASPEILALQGKVWAARGNAAAARAAFMKALQIDPDAIDALGGLVELETKAGQAARLRPQIDQALARHPKDPAYLFLSAEIAAAEKNLPRAEQALRAILDGDGAHEDAALLLTSILADQGRLKDAQGVAEKSLERLQTSAAVRMKLGEILELQGLAAESQAQYEKVISDNQLAGATTDMIDAFNTASARLAALFANQGIRLDQALQLASAAKRYRPNDPFFSDTLGWVHVRKDRARMGLPYLDAAVSAEPANPVFRYHLGVAYEQLGEFAKARIELSRALQGNAKFMGVDDARALLKAVGK